ncbi:hypothetical protein, partial [Proteus mirabilis]
SPPTNDSSFIHIPYRILIQQANLFNNQIQDSNLLSKNVFDRLKKYRLVKEEDIHKKDLIDKITLAINWVSDFNGMTEGDGDVDGSEFNVKVEMSN